MRKSSFLDEVLECAEEDSSGASMKAEPKRVVIVRVPHVISSSSFHVRVENRDVFVQVASNATPGSAVAVEL